MAEDKKGFLMYADQKDLFEELSDEEAGRLIKHIMRYVNDENPEAPDRITKISFTPIKKQLKRDLKAYEEIRQKRSEWGKAGGKKSAEQRKGSQGTSSIPQGTSTPLEATQANQADNVNGNDTVNVNEINNTRESVPNINRFKLSTTDQESMVKYAGGLGKILSIKRVVELSESHDIAFAEQFKNGTYDKWKQYFRYFIDKHKEPFKPNQTNATNLTAKRVNR